MNWLKMALILALVLVILSGASSFGKNSISGFSGPYFGKLAPVSNGEIFMDGVICKIDEPEMCAAFAENGKEFYFNRIENGKWTIFFTKEVSGSWTEPRRINFSSGFTDRDFTISPDGKKMFFGSDRPVESVGRAAEKLDVWVSTRKGDGAWRSPVNIGAPVNTKNFGENYPSVAANGNLYFFSCRNIGIGSCDIFYSVFSKGKYLEPVNLGLMINSGKNDWDSFIAPDESYIIFSSQSREDTLGGQDLYIAFRSKGGWAKAVNMGPGVNSSSGEICPSVTPDGKYLFFTSRRRGKSDIFWISTKIITKIRTSSME